MSLQVSLRQVCSLAALHNATHEERTSCALLNPLHRITTAKSEGERIGFTKNRLKIMHFISKIGLFLKFVMENIAKAHNSYC